MSESPRFLNMNPPFFELCSESLPYSLAGQAGGADRVELCSALHLGGITPSPEVIASAVRALSIPVYVLIRPRAGNFAYTKCEFDLMRLQIEEAKKIGARGVAIGVLSPDGLVDVARTRELVELARPLSVTFHRAFDETKNLSESLERVIDTGANDLLTSGGAADVLSGVKALSDLVRQAGNRIRIIAGGGLRLESVAEIVRQSGVRALHGSFTRKNGHDSTNGFSTALEANVRQAITLLRDEYKEPLGAARVTSSRQPSGTR
jgi:copper homeostasis protein